MKSSLKTRGITAFVWDFLGRLSTQGLSFIVTIFLARLLEPSDFGLIAMAMVVVGMAQVFTDAGLSAALIQRTKVLEIHYSSVFFFNLISGITLTAIFFYSSGYIANFYGNEKLTPIIQSISFLFIINTLCSVQSAKLKKELKYGILTKVSFSSSMLSGCIGILLALYGFGVWSLLAQIIIQSLIFTMILWSVSNWRPKLAFSFKALKQLWNFGFRIFLSGLIDAVFRRADFIIIGKLFNTQALGYFQRAKQFNGMLVQFISGSLTSVLFPVLSELKNQLPKLQQVVLKLLHIICLTSFLFIGSLYLLAEDLIVFIFSDKWLPSVQYLQILLLSGFAYPISALLVNVLKGRGNSKVFLRLEIIKKSAHAFNFLNIIYFGVNSYLYGLLGLAFFGVSLNIYYCAKELRLNFNDFSSPILLQMCLSLFSVFLILMLLHFIEPNYIIGLLIKSVGFVVVFLGFNLVLNTKSYSFISQQIQAVIKSQLKKKEIKNA
jgi:O-antigen/teichoic acid export membrane protein